MGIHYDYKSTRGAKAMEKQAKREKKLAEKRAKKQAKTGFAKEKEQDKTIKFLLYIHMATVVCIGLVHATHSGWFDSIGWLQ